jgi:Protein of unknown function (DUF3047)
MPAATLLILALALAAPSMANAQQATAAPVVATFSAAKPGPALPSGWEVLSLGSTKTPTEFKFVDEASMVVLKAHAEAAASGLNHRVKFDIQNAPIIQFRWKIGSLIEGADNKVASKEDSPVRIVLGFDGDKSKLTFGEKTKSLLARSATGKDLPYAQLIYVWANNHPVGTVIANPHTKRVQMVVAVSGAAEVGKWVTLSRNVVDDFKRAFGEEPGLMTDVGIMTDTDNTGATVDAWYGDIRFLATPP